MFITYEIREAYRTDRLFHIEGRHYLPARKNRAGEKMKSLLCLSIQAYQMLISPLLPAVCRFQPSCSEYAILAIQKYGPIKGVYKAVRRLLCCHPFSRKHGWDPV